MGDLKLSKFSCFAHAEEAWSDPKLWRYTKRNFKLWQLQQRKSQRDEICCDWSSSGPKQNSVVKWWPLTQAPPCDNKKCNILLWKVLIWPSWSNQHDTTLKHQTWWILIRHLKDVYTNICWAWPKSSTAPSRSSKMGSSKLWFDWGLWNSVHICNFLRPTKKSLETMVQTS